MIDSATSRISDKPGHEVAEVVFTHPEDVRAWRVTFGPSRDDRVLQKRGQVCGIGDVCGEGNKPLFVAGGDEIVATFDYDDTQPAADGTYEIGVHAHGDVVWL